MLSKSLSTLSPCSTLKTHPRLVCNNKGALFLKRGKIICATSNPAVAQPEVKLAKSSLVSLEQKSGFEDLQLPQLEVDHDVRVVDLIVAGAGPSGLAIAERVSRQGLSVVVVDPNPLGEWPNNYGVWVDEFDSMGLGNYLDIVWPRARVFLGSDAQKDDKYLHRAYGRVDRYRLKRMFLEKCINQGVKFVTGKVDHLEQQVDLQEVMLKVENGKQRNSVKGLLVIDATGHARKLVQFKEEFDPGYQGAYGIMANVDHHPFDLDTMIFMDWRDDHCKDDPKMKAANDALPTFLYVMPISDTQVFLEETSLVARPAVPFNELKRRLYKRLDSLGVKVKSVEEQEYCLIPMGGVLPQMPQRVLGIGGTAGMVHPSTGYMVARSLSAIPSLADNIVDQISEFKRMASLKDESITIDKMTANAWQTVWPVWRLKQRHFFNLGMEVLLKFNLEQTREFFRAFFSLEDYYWQGFLSTRLDINELIYFGLSLFANASWDIRKDVVIKGAPELPVLFYKVLTQEESEKNQGQKQRV